MAEIKTKPTSESVTDFISKVPDDQKRKDSLELMKIMQDATGEEPQMWGPSLIGFGNIRIKSAASGREVNWIKIGFSPRKANLSLYLSINISEYAASLQKLGKHKTGVGCLYINKLSDIDLDVLKEIITASLKKN